MIGVFELADLLVLAETDRRNILPSSQSALHFAQEYCKVTGGAFSLLIIGHPDIEAQAAHWINFGAASVLLSTHSELEFPTADKYAETAMQAFQKLNANSIAGASTTFGRDILPRIAGLLDLPMISDLLSFEKINERMRYKRPMFAGNIIAAVEVEGPGAVFSIRTTTFTKTLTTPDTSKIETIVVDPSTLPNGTRRLKIESTEQKRPELTTARVVVSGGRPLRDSETFERLLGGLADKLGGAVGATRAAVDSGIAPNELQVGQTGKVVAPELYIAAGISGSVQHLAGMKESKVIVAINTDPDAPIFEVADYGLVADLHQALPELTSKI